MPSIDDLVAELAAVPPREFARERSALVARLHGSGQRDAAARLKAVPRPTTAVWAVNRLAHEQGEDVDRLIAASQRMRAAQLGRAGARDLTAASADHRTLLARLSERAEAILRGAHLGASHQVLLRIQTTLTAAAADPALRSALREGRIEREVAARGFDVFGGEMPRPSSTRRTRAPVPARSDAAITSARQELTQREIEATAREKTLTEARDRVAELTKLLNVARRVESEKKTEARRAATAVQVARVAVRSAEKRRGRGRRGRNR